MRIKHPYGGPEIVGTRLQKGDKLQKTDLYASVRDEWLINPAGEGVVLQNDDVIWVRPKVRSTEEKKPEYRVLDTVGSSGERLQDLINQLHGEGYDYLDVVDKYMIFRKQGLALDRENNRCGECSNCVAATTYQKFTVPNFLESIPCQRL